MSVVKTVRQRGKGKQCKCNVMRHILKRQVKGSTLLFENPQESYPKPSCPRFAPLR